MALSMISREAVFAAIAECDRAGRTAFRSWHGYGSSSAFELVCNRRRYDSKAIVGVAHGYQNTCDPMHPSEFSGGLEHSARLLVNLGFTVRRGRERLTQAAVALPQRVSRRPCSADLMLFVVRPTNERSVAACVEHGFGTLLSPMTVVHGAPTDISGHVHPTAGLPFVLDNGAWACHQAGVEWMPDPFLRLLDRLGAGPGRTSSTSVPRFAVLPDIVGEGERSLERSIGFWEKHRGEGLAERVGQWMLAVQDGVTPDIVRPLLEQHRFGIFVGGSTEWKWRTVHDWAELGLELGTRVHVGRVNSLRRAMLCRDIGVSSIDGSSVTVYSVNAPKMARAHDGDDRPLSPLAEPPARHTIARRRFELTLGAPP